MKQMHILAVAAIMASTLVLPARAEDTGVGQFAWMLIREGIKQRFMPNAAPEGTAPVPDIALPQKTADGCEILRDRRKSGKPSMGISRPGRYCLDKDYEFECTIFTHGCGGQLIDIRADDVDIDFRGHTVRMSGTRGYIGVWGFGRNIRVHNGRIRGAGVGIMLSDRGRSPQDAYPAMPVNSDHVFTDTGFVVERMQFSDVQTAVMVSGSGNQIHDNRIDATLDAVRNTGAPFALLSYGPAARIERNTFRLHDLTPGMSGYAIYVRSGERTLIGDNNVRVDDAQGTVGIGLSSSTGVVLRQNWIDTEKVTELDERSSLQPANPDGKGMAGDGR